MATRRKKRKSTQTTKSFWIVIIALVLFAFIFNIQGGNIPFFSVNKLPLPNEGEIRVCFLDVGQGDSILIQTNEHSVLIDSGEYTEKEKVISYLKEAGVGPLDILIATHPHSDHIGAMADVINEYETKLILMPDAVNGTVSFEHLMDAIEKNGVPVEIPKPGDVFKAGLIELETMSPEPGPYSSLNDSSIVLRLLYGDTAFLFMGDAEQNIENKILNSNFNVRASILKAGHHGSDTSSSGRFLDEVRPAAVVISCGAGNQYGHPSDAALGRFAERGIEVYRTDEDGSLIMVTDGTEIKLYYKDER